MYPSRYDRRCVAGRPIFALRDGVYGQLPEALLKKLLGLRGVTANTLVKAATVVPHSDNATAILIDIL